MGTIEFPHFCPGWCDREDHLAFATENEGIDAAEKLLEHRRSSVGDTYLLPKAEYFIDKMPPVVLASAAVTAIGLWLARRD